MSVLIAERYGLSPELVRQWKSRVKKSKNILQNDKGRPPALDEESVLGIKRKVIEAELPAEEGIAPSTLADTHQLFLEEVAATKKRRLFTPGSSMISANSQSMGVSTVDKYKAETNIRDRVVQDLTDARYKAMRDFRLFYVHACLVWGLCRFLETCQIHNGDFTTFIGRPEGSGMKVCVVRETGDRRQVASTAASGELNVLIKYYGQGCGKGDIAKVLLVLAIPTMPEGVFFYRLVVGVSQTSEAGSSGHVYACATRGGTKEMWKHMFLHCVVPEVRKTSLAYECKDSEGHPQRAVYSSDGEACILEEAFDDEVQQAFKDNCIDYIKKGPSLTSKQQEWDVSDNFKDTKAVLHTLVTQGNHEADTVLQRNIHDFLQELKAAYPGVVVITAAQDAKICFTFDVIVAALKKANMSYKLREGFFRAGTVRRGPRTPGVDTCDLHQLLAGCASKVTEAEYGHAITMVPVVARQLLLTGRALNTFLDEKEIVRVEGVTDRDTLTFSRCEPFLITHALQASHWQEVIRLRDLAKDPDHIAALAAAKELAKTEATAKAAADKLQAEDAKSVEKDALKAADKSSKAEAQRVEKIRFSSLSTEEKAAEKLAAKEAKEAKAAVTLANKLQKNVDRDARLAAHAASTLLVGGGSA